MKNNDLAAEIGLKIRHLREKRGLSLRVFEAVVGMPRGNLSAIELGKRNLSVEMLQRIAGALDAEVEVFFREN